MLATAGRSICPDIDRPCSGSEHVGDVDANHGRVMAHARNASAIDIGAYPSCFRWQRNGWRCWSYGSNGTRSWLRRKRRGCRDFGEPLDGGCCCDGYNDFLLHYEARDRFRERGGADRCTTHLQSRVIPHGGLGIGPVAGARISRRSNETFLRCRLSVGRWTRERRRNADNRRLDC